MKNILFSLFVVMLLCFTNVVFAQCGYSANDAIEYVGEYCEVTGTVVTTYQSKINQAVFLNFEKDYPNQVFKVVIFPDFLSNFKKDPMNYAGQKLKVRGKVDVFRGDVQIIVENEGGIEVIEWLFYVV